MKKLNKIIAASLLASVATAGSGVALAGSPLTGNVGVASNYMWRGVSQTTEGAAISGGIDYAHASGAYIGTWVSNQNWTGAGNYEHDLYAGYKFDAGPVGLDIGYINYMYPIGGTANDFSEVYVNASYSMFSAGVAIDSKNKSQYISVGAEFEVKKDLTLGVTFGSYDFDGAGDYTHTKLSLSKDDFTFAYDTADMAGTAGDPRVTVSWGQSFDL